MPTTTDLVTDLPADFEVFGQAVDTQMKTNADAATQKATLTTTGDIYYASSASTPARLGIGTTAQVLTVVGGVPAWSTSTGFEPVLTQETATQYIRNLIGNSELNATANTTYYMPIFLPTFSADRIGVRTGPTAGGTNGNVRLGLYNVSSTTGKPTTVLLDAGTVSVTAASTEFQITISQNITAGWYYLAFNNQGSTTWRITSGGTVGATTTYPAPLFNITGAAIQSTSATTGFTESSITGAFATAGTLTAITTGVPILGTRIA